MPAFQSAEERIYYRDVVRQARYAALSDAEGFEQACFALERVGVHLLGREASLKQYEPKLRELVEQDEDAGPKVAPEYFTPFTGLYRVVREARNDAMHSGARARHVTSKAIELCLLLEDAIMNGGPDIRRVDEHMVKEPVFVEPWQPVARARQLMLMHSFSNLPVFVDGEWKLLTELGLACYLLKNGDTSSRRRLALGARIGDAAVALNLVTAPTTSREAETHSLLMSLPAAGGLTALWVVLGDNALPPDNRPPLLGVISAFELM